ncbi:hypothetical protein [Thomasclavelia sp.]|uniref:hypothetical protein n=1 Tax=Thomasclavelia sp. TaxID=3025757 RepID=UPI0025F28423|nr:hypothetical protein [Thomasclavelia sp.]
MILTIKFNKKNAFSYILWAIILFSYFFQFPFSFLSQFIVPSVMLLIILNTDVNEFKRNKLFSLNFLLFLIFLCIPFIISIFKNVEMSRIMRFFLILISIPLCTQVKLKNYDNYYRIMIFFAIIKSILLVLIALYLIKTNDHTLIRNWVLANNLGDIYLAGSFSPRVQVQGNAFLVVIFILSFIKNNKFRLSNIILLFGILAAGNFAFVLGLILFVFYKMYLYVLLWSKKNKQKLMMLIVAIIIIIAFLIPYINAKIEIKSLYSNVVRIEQIKVLTEGNFLIGEGLGSVINASTTFRNYNNDIYFELQTLYIYNQIGIIGLFLFYMTLFSAFFKKRMTIVIVYCIYLFYALWNPYCFDTTQMMATIIIINLPNYVGGRLHEKNCINDTI